MVVDGKIFFSKFSSDFYSLKTNIIWIMKIYIQECFGVWNSWNRRWKIYCSKRNSQVEWNFDLRKSTGYPSLPHIRQFPTWIPHKGQSFPDPPPHIPRFNTALQHKSVTSSRHFNINPSLRHVTFLRHGFQTDFYWIDGFVLKWRFFVEVRSNQKWEKHSS